MDKQKNIHEDPVIRPEQTEHQNVEYELLKARGKAAVFEEVCRFTVASHYEETGLIDIKKDVLRPLLETDVRHPAGLFEACREHYDKGIRTLMEKRASSPADRGALATLLLKDLVPVLMTEGKHKVRCRLKGVDSQERWKQIECAFFGEDRQTVLILVSDVQEEENVKEQLLEAAEAAEAANQAKSAFLANMSHEIRTPMNAIVGISEVLLGKDLPQDVRNSLTTIQNSGSSLLGIINDILDFSKIETGKFEITEVEYMIPSLLMDISNVISVRLSGKPVNFLMDVDPKIPNHFLGDDIRIKQILMNLIGNAVKFTREGYIELCVWGKFLEGDQYELHFDVKDSGIGIKEEDLGKLFDSFTQVDTRKNRATQGSGLGLTISRNLAKLMGGDLTVSSVYGKGSTFSVSILQKVPRYVPLGEVKDRNVRILVCERNESIIFGLSRTLENLELEYEVCREPERIRNYQGFTHVLIRRNVFDSVREKLEFMFEQQNIYLILDHDEQPDGAHMEYKQLQLPLIALQLINALNGEEIYSSAKKQSFDRSQIIPLTYARVLVVDDNTTNLQVAQGLMLPYKMQVDVANSGFKAIEMVRSNRYDAIFMDHMMPEMDGIETAQYIREMKGDYFKKVPIIALTANAMNDARDMFLETGMDDFVAKPIEMRQLHRVIKKYIQSKAPAGYLEKAARAANEAAKKSGKGSAAEGGKSPSANTSKGALSAPAAAATVAAKAGTAAVSLQGTALEKLLEQNNLLLSQNMLLLQAIFGNTEKGSAGLTASSLSISEETGAGEEGALCAGEDTAAPETSAADDQTGDIAEDLANELPDFISGIDMQKTMETYGGSLDIYHNILKTYYYDIMNQQTVIQDYFDRQDTENFTIQVHAVKSASRGVGANDLGEEAYQLEMAGKAGNWDEIRKLYPTFAADLRQMVEDVGAYAKKYLLSDDEEAGELCEAFDPELVAKLKASCEQMEYQEAEDILRELKKKSYPEELSKTLEEMLASCESFDYEHLETLLEEL